MTWILFVGYNDLDAFIGYARRDGMGERMNRMTRIETDFICGVGIMTWMLAIGPA